MVNLSIEVDKYGDVDKAIKAFSRKVKKAGIIEKYMSSTRYTKPSLEKHQKKRYVLFQRKKKDKKCI